MGLDVYFRRDIANVLRAVALAGSDVVVIGGTELEQDEAKQIYHQGQERTLAAVGLGFGLHQMVSKEHRDGPEWIEMDREAGQ